MESVEKKKASKKSRAPKDIATPETGHNVPDSSTPTQETTGLEAVVKNLLTNIEREKAFIDEQRQELQQEKKNLVQEKLEVEQQRRDFEISLDRARNQVGVARCNIVDVNVGGRIFSINVNDVVSKFPQSYFGAALSGRWSSTADNGGERNDSKDESVRVIRVDRSGTLFHHIADFIRYYDSPLVEGVTLEEVTGISDLTRAQRAHLRQEADFYRLVPLMEALVDVQASRDLTDDNWKWVDWRPEKPQKSLQLLNDNMTVTTSSENEVSVIGSVAWLYGIHKWTLYVSHRYMKDDQDEIAYLGVVYEDRIENIGFSISCHGDGEWNNNGEPDKSFYLPIPNGSILDLALDFNAKTLSLSRRGGAPFPIVMYIPTLVNGTILYPFVRVESDVVITKIK